jgi:uncharacterized DUF497 family protein
VRRENFGHRTVRQSRLPHRVTDFDNFSEFDDRQNRKERVWRIEVLRHRTMTKRFEWDRTKAARNFRKHGVTFDEARTVFADGLAGIGPDPDHSSAADERALIAGQSSQSRLVLVSFVEHGDVVRIISARLLTRYERRLYEEEKFP